jgi:cyclic pyranopterin phosphate synthase
MALSHTNPNGSAKMVDISGKDSEHREAVANGKVILKPETIRLIRENQMQKGDVIATARIAGIAAAKKTADLIPLCHNIGLNQVTIDFNILEDSVTITSKVVCDGKTGVEMEALTAVAVAALTIYDMCKAVDNNIIISHISLRRKMKHAIHC